MCTYYLFHISNNQHISYLFPCQLKRIMQDQHYVRTENLTKMLYFCVLFNRLYDFHIISAYFVTLFLIYLHFVLYLNLENGSNVCITYVLDRLRRIEKFRKFYKTQNNACYASYAICVSNEIYGFRICEIMRSRNTETDSSVSWVYHLSLQ